MPVSGDERMVGVPDYEVNVATEVVEGVSVSRVGGVLSVTIDRPRCV